MVKKSGVLSLFLLVTFLLTACQPSNQQKDTTNNKVVSASGEKVIANNNQINFDETYKQLEEISIQTKKYQDRHTGSEGAKEFLKFLQEKLRNDSLTPVLHPFKFNDITGTNITVDIKGDSDDTILVGAHYDSVKGSPGINDNGTGVAILMALAEKLAHSPIKPKKSIRLAFWDAEEPGVIGSKAYVDSLSKTDKEKIKLYLNIDTVGSKNGRMLILDAKKESLNKLIDEVPEAQKSVIKEVVKSFDQLKFSPGSIPLQEFLLQSAKETGYPMESDLISSISTDTNSFIKDFPTTGIVVTAISSRSNNENGKESEIIDFAPCYHQACDTIEKIDRATLTAVIKVVNDVIEKYAF